MKGIFYIVNIDNEDRWYRLHLTSTHHCIGGCEDYKSLLQTVIRLITKYKKESRIERVVQKVCGPLSDSVLKSYEKDYEDFIDCEYEMEKAIEKACEKVRDSSPIMKSIKRIKKNKKVLPTLKDKKEDKKVVVEKEKISVSGSGEIVIKRPLLLRRK